MGTYGYISIIAMPVSYTHLLHVHPTLVNGLTCGKGAQTLCEQLLGKDVLWIDICKPGYTLARICYEKMNEMCIRDSSDRALGGSN